MQVVTPLSKMLQPFNTISIAKPERENTHERDAGGGQWQAYDKTRLPDGHHPGENIHSPCHAIPSVLQTCIVGPEKRDSMFGWRLIRRQLCCPGAPPRARRSTSVMPFGVSRVQSRTTPSNRARKPREKLPERCCAGVQMAGHDARRAENFKKARCACVSPFPAQCPLPEALALQTNSPFLGVSYPTLSTMSGGSANARSVLLLRTTQTERHLRFDVLFPHLDAKLRADIAGNTLLA
ncbi:hypothetical protein F5144DRAFT_294412 [Chaetomium tenue]|uniref:Uncharacterized protein n=1 Tax=Chaetomium tenue TaxID=1854479 RepID=A0ACB7P4D4_9PEZI|nr:hypothetical protein F5144DRAFT_294412 [Chaetomium globosum]